MIDLVYQNLRSTQTAKRDQLKQLKREYESTRLQINVLKDQQKQIEAELTDALNVLQEVGEILDEMTSFVELP